MRRSTSRAQLELPLAAEAEPTLPDPRPASECARCGWYREGATACPVCRTTAVTPPPPTDVLPTPGPRLPPRRRPRARAP